MFKLRDIKHNNRGSNYLIKSLVVGILASCAMIAGLSQAKGQLTHLHPEGHDSQKLCHGFVPENDLYIPVGGPQALGIEEGSYHEVLDRVEEVYAPIVAESGGELVVSRAWSNGRVNATAHRSGRRFIITMFGGLARHEAITADGFLLVACHEIGHHIGGAPKYGSWFTSWASSEGQSDYFANLRCMRRVFTDEDNAHFVRNNYIDPFVVVSCQHVWSDSVNEQNRCMRASMAGLSVAQLFQALREEETDPRFDTPDPNQVDDNQSSHPATQCRLDTYFQASLCRHDMDQPLDDRNANIGTCSRTHNDPYGHRPLCWYRPSL